MVVQEFSRIEPYLWSQLRKSLVDNDSSGRVWSIEVIWVVK